MSPRDEPFNFDHPLTVLFVPEEGQSFAISKEIFEHLTDGLALNVVQTWIAPDDVFC